MEGSRELTTAIAAAKAAEPILLRYFQQGVDTELKADASPYQGRTSRWNWRYSSAPTRLP